MAKKNVKKVPKKKKVRRNIRKLITNLNIRTSEAVRLENERKKRIESLPKIPPNILDSNLVVDEKLFSFLKPYQQNGVKFMWNCCYESIEAMNNGQGGGCILAHCMGLGKTLQVIALTHTLLTHRVETLVEKILILSPKSVVLNWVDEYHKWITEKHITNINIFQLSKCKINERAAEISKWHTQGGVLILGYQAFSNLITSDDDDCDPSLEDIELKEQLLNPGPDLVICDEGHLLKNENTVISEKLSSIRTMRRIALTGTPLQNNLKEYFCMVNFVKPYLLGTMKEFNNRFLNPIKNGQYSNSTQSDINLMTRRSYVLHDLLGGCIHRLGESELAKHLPPKEEYVIYLRLSSLQAEFYKKYVTLQRSFAEEQQEQQLTSSTSSALFVQQQHSSSQLLQDFHTFKKICTHPALVDNSYEKATDSNDDSDDESFTSSSEEEDHRSTDDVILEKIVKRQETRWWEGLWPEGVRHEKIEWSSKLILLFSLIEECDKIGDKLLVFSQSLATLNLIESYLTSHYKWKKGEQFYRLDGSISKAATRKSMCDTFNNMENKKARLFLISTEAGCLGINLVAANRVVLFDASWNPSSDSQAIHRIYRHGQLKTCYVYRFIALGTMEEQIYKRQVNKISLSKRVLDAKKTDRHYEDFDLAELYCTEQIETDSRRSEFNEMPNDQLLAGLLQKHCNLIKRYHIHDTLVKEYDHCLDQREMQLAWDEFENQKEKEKNTPTRRTVRIPFSEDPEERDIFGFKTSELLDLLKQKSKNSRLDVPQLITQLHYEMRAENKTLYNELMDIKRGRGSYSGSYDIPDDSDDSVN